MKNEGGHRYRGVREGLSEEVTFEEMATRRSEAREKQEWFLKLRWGQLTLKLRYILPTGRKKLTSLVRGFDS